MNALAVALVAALAAPATASPLGVAWKQAVTCTQSIGDARDHVLVPAGDSLYWLARGKLERRAIATGAAHGKPVAIKATGKRAELSAAGSLVMISDGKTIAIHDAATGKATWSRKVVGTLQRVGLTGDAVGMVEHARGKRRVSLLDGATGKPRWTKDLDSAASTSWVTGTATRIYVASTVGAGAGSFEVAAFSAADGAPAWTYRGTSRVTGREAFVIGDQLAFTIARAMVIVDGTGAGKQMPFAESPDLDWIDTRTRRAYLQAGHDIFAVDLTSLKPLWKFTARSGYVEVVQVDGHRVYITDEDELRELDGKTGALVTALGIANMSIAAVEGKPRIYGCTGAELIAYDPAAVDLPFETATLTGTVECPGCNGRTVSLRFGGVTATPDEDGSFSLTAKVRGRHELSATFSGQDFFRHPLHTVTLTGKRSYKLGTLEAEPLQEGG